MGDDLCRRVSKHNTAPQMFIELDSDFGPRERLLTLKAAPPCTDVFTSSVSVYETCSAQSEITRMDVISMTWVPSRATDAGTDEVCGQSGWFCRLGWWLVGGGSRRCGDAVGFRTAQYLMGLCTLSGSGGWRKRLA